MKMIISLPERLKDLERYAAAHTRLYGDQVNATVLISYMLARFIESDRGFKRQKNEIWQKLPFLTVPLLWKG